MTTLKSLEATSLYRIALVEPRSRRILAQKFDGANVLPVVSIPHRSRPAGLLQEAAWTQFGLAILILDILFPSPAGTPCAVAEILVAQDSPVLEAVPLHAVAQDQMTEEQRTRLQFILEDRDLSSPFVRLGWITEAEAWIATATGTKVSSRTTLKQLNAGGRFSLVRFRTEDGHHYWLKATGEPNAHELAVTEFLSAACGKYLPKFVGTKPEWNAWLMAGDAIPLREIPSEPLAAFRALEKSVVAIAELQIATVGQSQQLLTLGAFSQSVTVLRHHCDALFDYLAEVMALQTSTKVEPLSAARLQQLRSIVIGVYERLQHLEIPETIVHGDLNPGNILERGDDCQFIDWSEACVGIPVTALQFLLLLNKIERLDVRQAINNQLKRRYRDLWKSICDPTSLDAALPYMPVLAVVSVLYGRGNWFHMAQRDDPRWQSYSRSLARHLDRAAQEPEFMEALCH